VISDDDFSDLQRSIKGFRGRVKYSTDAVSGDKTKVEIPVVDDKPVTEPEAKAANKKKPVVSKLAQAQTTDDDQPIDATVKIPAVPKEITPPVDADVAAVIRDGAPEKAEQKPTKKVKSALSEQSKAQQPADKPVEAEEQEEPEEEATHYELENIVVAPAITPFTFISSGIRGFGSFLGTLLASQSSVVSKMDPAEQEAFMTKTLHTPTLKKLEKEGKTIADITTPASSSADSSADAPLKQPSAAAKAAEDKVTKDLIDIAHQGQGKKAQEQAKKELDLYKRQQAQQIEQALAQVRAKEAQLRAQAEKEKEDLAKIALEKIAAEKRAREKAEAKAAAEHVGCARSNPVTRYSTEVFRKLAI
jgi:hypothetical protein